MKDKLQNNNNNKKKKKKKQYQEMDICFDI